MLATVVVIARKVMVTCKRNHLQICYKSVLVFLHVTTSKMFSNVLRMLLNICL